MEKKDTEKSEVKVARKEYARHDAEQKEYARQILPLQKNLLVLRETFNLIYGKMLGIKPFYNAIECSDDAFSNFLTKRQLSQKIHKIIAENLHSMGVEKSSLRLIDALPFDFSIDMNDALDVYFNEHSTKADKEWAIQTLRTHIAKQYCENNIHIAGLVVICHNIASRSGDLAENYLENAYNVLDELDSIDFSEENIKSRQFAKFITELAKTVNTMEELFPEFYAVAQQMKEDKSAQSIMNEISNNLKSLNNMVLTSSDAKSNSCINMLKEISETMKNIYSKMV